MGFQAWLGKTVDSVLNPFKITTHMLAALLIVALQFVIYTVKKHNKTLIFNQKFNWILAGSLGLTIIQIVLGTTVREHVDIVSETGAPEIMWLQNPTIAFYIHRSFQ
jgi:cytochrome c oxidase assembly protein subunit 15